MLSDNVFKGENETVLQKLIDKFKLKLRRKLEKYIMYQQTRWIIIFVMLVLYSIRIYKIGGFYVVSYVLGLYILHLAVQFFTPLGVPDVDEDQELDDDSTALPSFVSEDQENQDRPLIRSMSEFNFWQNILFAIIIASFFTCSEIFDLPVFWPFLLCYFILLFFLTIKRQLKHMSQFNYSFLDFNKKITQ